MAALANAKHEAFARAIVEGKSGRDAYCGCGYKPHNDNTADACASRLLATAKVAARVAELKSEVAAQVVSKKVMDLTEVLEELSKIGRGSIHNYIAAGGDYSNEVIDALRDLTPEHAAAVQELTVETYMDGGGDDAREVKKVKLKLHDKRGALSELRRHYEPNKHELTGKDGKPIQNETVGEPMGELELARRLAFVLELGARKSKAGGSNGKLDQGRDQASGRAQAKSQGRRRVDRRVRAKAQAR